MKKTFFLLSILFLSFQSFSQQVYWQCSNVIIDNPSSFLSVWDDFMSTEVGKSMSANAIFQFSNSSSEFGATHQICWFSEDAADLDANFQQFMNSKMMNSSAVWETWNENVKVEANVLGQSLIADPAGFDLNFAMVYLIKVEDPASYAAAFIKMKKAFDDTDREGVIELHEMLAGQESGVTHEVIVRSPNMKEWIEGRNEFTTSKAFQEFISSTRSYSEILHVLSGQPLKFYNID